MMAQFMMDLKTEPRLSPSLYSPASPKLADQNCRPQSTDSGVLDLSKRRDSLDTRKTPSPAYHCFSDAGGTPPPSNHSSPQCEPVGQTAESAILLNYGELMRARRLSPSKSLLHFDELARPAALVTGPSAFHHHHPHHQHHHHQLHQGGMAKPDTDILQQHLLQQVQRSPAIPSYLLPAAALQQQHHHLQQPQQTPPSVVFSPSPIRTGRELDALSESGSEGTSLVTSSQRKPKDDATDGQQQQQQYPMVVGRDGKLSRPFKAYPRDPLSLAAGFVASDTILDTNSTEKYNLFRKRMLEQIHAANGGQPTVSNPKMRRLASNSSKGLATMSDASSESCDEKPPSKAAAEPAPISNMASIKGKKQQNLTSVCNAMAQRAAAKAANQRREGTPLQSETPACDSDSSHQSDGDSKQNATDSSSCDVVTGSGDATLPHDKKSSTDNGAPNAPSSSGGSGSVKDSAYYERRKKNNAAAKKSRDRRRIKEDEIAIRAAFLERENIELKFELAAARKQLSLYGVGTASVAS
ncbi:protein giant [Anopheles ziemanni]|uniref:protein giant n=1 Tax=Anopheles coustani TaxID=139045 RepID=UPI00265A96AD|nr:protein giant [Anopheles coustani]XP_058173129.1 protein giant [Anopheles ziemanni]